MTQLLLEAGSGDKEAMDALYPHVYNQLRDIAKAQLSKERSGHTIQKTALVHEVYLKLIDQTRVDWQGRTHFYAIASRAMRQILIDYARKRNAQKRGGNQEPLPFDEEKIALDNHTEQLLELNDLIDKLAEFDERKSRVVEMRFFGGMTIREIAELLDVSTRTIDRDWLKARGWIYQELTKT
ncbi:sigma-70 family RNA polymerase sigma factor [Fodinibius salsisoli]|uniref:Sigma-70 family RNA polymerase sigma factor n=1 Tax=Fodinibius salsisoli TaxID=2820877 RepID=A0ABT3PRL2_9BACT|nr:sigma-70 family RNA polymerase sigma factor [Fodinibius salsisoli]MCW9708499.1 sigma-70 family RNA polymerase sigma factor [Fodinibius salsisoli]